MVGKGRGEGFFSLVLDFALQGFHSFQAALDLHMCGDNMATLCCSEKDGQYPSATGPQGNQSSFQTSHPCHRAGNGELGILGFILPAAMKFMCEP